jgi:hypothetical protein
VALKLRTCQVYCPQCHVYESLLFYGKKLIGNTKWTQGDRGRIFHTCKRPCAMLSFD